MQNLSSQISPNSYQALLSEHNIALLSDWLAETHELLVIIYFPHSAGLQDIYFVESLPELRKVLSEQTFPEIRISIFREKQFPLRGQVNNSFIEQALKSMADGKRYTIIKFRKYPNPCEWVDDSESSQQIKDALENLKDEFAGFGIDPFEAINDKEHGTYTRFFRLDVSKNQNNYEPFSKEPNRYASILAEWNKAS
jgi:hypothetical protein